METNQLASNYIIEDVSDVWSRLRYVHPWHHPEFTIQSDSRNTIRYILNPGRTQTKRSDIHDAADAKHTIPEDGPNQGSAGLLFWRRVQGLGSGRTADKDQRCRRKVYLKQPSTACFRLDEQSCLT